MFLLSHVKPSPIVHHSTPRAIAAFCSPTFHFSDFKNWITHTFQPRAAARMTVPKAAVDFPLPSPVFTITIEDAFLVARAGPCVGTSFDFTAAPHPNRMSRAGAIAQVRPRAPLRSATGPARARDSGSRSPARGGPQKAHRSRPAC